MPTNSASEEQESFASPLRVIRPGHWITFFAIAAALLFLFELATLTKGLRMVSGDDVIIADGFRTPDVTPEYQISEFRIGRFYAVYKFYISELLIRISDDSWHSAFRVGAFLVAVLAAGWFTWEWRRSRNEAGLVVLMALGLAPVSLGYQALLAYPTLWLGWAAVWAMGALALKPDTVWTRSAITLAFALALMAHESNAVFVVWPAMLRWSAHPAGAAAFSFRQLVTSGAVLLAYGVISLALRHRALTAFPGPQYDGAALSLDVREMFFALNAYTWSGLPGLDSWLERSSAIDASCWLSPLEWLRRSFSSVTAPGAVGSLVLGIALWIGTSPKAVPAEANRRPPGWTLVVLFFAAFASNVLISCTQKYQVWAHQRMWPYYYTAMSYLIWVVLLVGMVAGALTLIRKIETRRVARVLVAAAVLLVALGTDRANREAAGLLRQHPFLHMPGYRQWFPSR